MGRLANRIRAALPKRDREGRRVFVLEPVRKTPDPRRYAVPDLETKKAMATELVDSLLASDETTAMMILNNPRSWPER